MSQKRTRWVAVASVVTMLGVAIAATALARTRAGDAPPASDQAIPAALASPGPNDLAGSIDLDDPVDLDGMGESRDRVVSPATDPRRAVEGFLAAEKAGDLARSYQFLSASDRKQLASEQDWIAAHADLVPPVTDYEIDGPARDGVIPSTLRLESSLDEVIGLVPARAQMRWQVVEGPAGRWSIDLARSELEPQLPPDDDAVAATTAWVQSRQHCASNGEWEGGLVGFSGLADALCDRAGEVVVGRAQPLDGLDVEPFITTFGDDAVTWARVVPVERPASLRAVLAPLDDRWVVIGVLDTEL
jgi:hypothetical protein